ncbi:hypothetical protein NZD89_21325 [Alicyclobacillus fastidiosus]|uniref:Uncharacterized protein n=1 Tax=Alicyclobacillus fastidiosus TaxID=392011 RepID=A0ABY6ZD96_9BACL|nr:hypothetical protein [Alicyclobacillus fastidiosus]WAH40812.1 hypothetical protein NZD89_21325 [Alicyclobacillus fastidiosus]GMA62293.1 hypothetical protein GCM10025859_27330 [Alicyclobacillus fastidiosus]
MSEPEKHHERGSMVDEAGRTIVEEKSPDDFCFEGGDCAATGGAQAIAGDLRTLAANDNPDDLEGEPYRL